MVSWETLATQSVAPRVDDTAIRDLSAASEVVISHLFGSIHKANHLIREAKDLGLLVVEDCAQGRTEETLWNMDEYGRPCPSYFSVHNMTIQYNYI